MRVLLDTNVILDVWLAREPFWRDSARLLGMVEGKEIEGVICPTTVTTLHFLGKKILGEKKARELVKDLIGICSIGNISEATFLRALGSEIRDFEDAVIESVASEEAMDFIATRNIKDFRKSRIKAKEPTQFL